MFFFAKQVLFGLLLYAIIFGLKESVTYYNWKKQYKQDFDKHVDSMFASFDEEKLGHVCQLYKEDPTKAPKWLWNEFSGEKATGIVLFPTIKSTIVFYIASWLFVIASIIAIIG